MTVGLLCFAFFRTAYLFPYTRTSSVAHFHMLNTLIPYLWWQLSALTSLKMYSFISCFHLTTVCILPNPVVYVPIVDVDEIRCLSLW